MGARSSSIATVVAVLLGGTACGGGGAGGGDADIAATRAQQLRSAAADAGLPPEVGDLLARAASAVGATYRVTYEVEGPGGTEVVTVTSDPPRRRVDSTMEGGDTARSFVVTDEGESVGCVRKQGAWTCEPAEGSAGVGVFDDEALEATVDRLAASRQTHVFDIERRTVAGAGATCLVTRSRDDRESEDAGALCVAPSGVPLLIERPGGTVRATAYTTTVEPDQLEVPGG